MSKKITQAYFISLTLISVKINYYYYTAPI